MWDEAKLEQDRAIREESIKELILVQIHPADHTKTTKIGALLLKNVQENFKAFFHKNVDVFA